MKPQRFTDESVVVGEREYKVTFDYWPATPDVMYLPNGDPGYPGDPAEVDIREIRDAAGLVIDGGLWSEIEAEILDGCYFIGAEDCNEQTPF